MTVFIVAEAGVNHQGDRAKMLALCDAAKAAGADAVKFQAYRTHPLCRRRGIDEYTAEGRKTWDLLSQSELADDDLDAIAAHCKAIGIKWFASVFDPSQIERVLSRGACALKIGHAEADWMELLDACCESNVPVWTSKTKPQDCHVVPDGTGNGGPIHCINLYPADGHPPQLRKVNYAYIKGFSSHYTDYRIPAAAALRGAEYIEAHLCLQDTLAADPSLWDTGEPEAAWSLNPHEFAAMVKLIREYSSWL